MAWAFISVEWLFFVMHSGVAEYCQSLLPCVCILARV